MQNELNPAVNNAQIKKHNLSQIDAIRHDMIINSHLKIVS